MSPLHDVIHWWPESIGLRLIGDALRGLSWLQAGGGTRGVGTRSSLNRQRRQSTTSKSGTLCATWARGLWRLWCSLLSIGSRELVHLWGHATDWGTLSRRVRINVLRHSA
jgi:hypothetical protein